MFVVRLPARQSRGKGQPWQVVSIVESPGHCSVMPGIRWLTFRGVRRLVLRFQRRSAIWLSSCRVWSSMTSSIAGTAVASGVVPGVLPIVSLDRIWVHPAGALRRIFAHTTPTARLASDHFPVVANIDAG